MKSTNLLRRTVNPARQPEKRSYHEVAPPSDYHKVTDSDHDGIPWSSKTSRYSKEEKKMLSELDFTYQGTLICATLSVDFV